MWTRMKSGLPLKDNFKTTVQKEILKSWFKWLPRGIPWEFPWNKNHYAGSQPVARKNVQDTGQTCPWAFSISLASQSAERCKRPLWRHSSSKRNPITHANWCLSPHQQEGHVSTADPPEKQSNSSIKHPPVPTCHPRMSPSPESTHASETSGGADNVDWLPSSFGLRRQLRKARRGTEEEAVLSVAPPGNHRGLFRAAGVEAAAVAPLTVFSSSWVSAGCSFCPSWATCPGTVTIGKLDDILFG